MRDGALFRGPSVGGPTRAAQLGKALFSDRGLSPSNTVSCATCHLPDKQLTDGLPVAHGVALGTRRTPRIGLASHARSQFWDGRADSLSSQALGPFENELEFASSRAFVARRVVSAHAEAYRAAFPDHPLPSLETLPPSGKPGEPAWESLSPATKDAVNAVFTDVGRALAAYERTFRITPSRLDAYLAGKSDALVPTERQGLSMFASAGCMQCHFGPRLTDDAFHVTHVPGDDRGRKGTGAFKTPPLRGVALGAPFGHSGSSPSLVAVTTLYGKGGDDHSVGTLEPWLPQFDETARWSIAGFLGVLDERVVVP